MHVVSVVSLPLLLSQDASQDKAQAAKYGFLLSRFGGQETDLWFEYLVASLLSSKNEADLTTLNPFLTPADAQVLPRLLCSCCLPNMHMLFSMLY